MMKSLILPAILFFSWVSHAADLTVQVTDLDGEAAGNSVITLKPLAGTPAYEAPSEKSVMIQKDQLFDPFMLAVKAGTKVTFPNLDAYRHHVYSFSKAKRFELRLYGQDENNEILFDNAGVVAIGCNIHDNMLAFIYITEEPIFAVSDDQGQVNFTGIPAGTYALQGWHPDIKSRKALKMEITVGAATTQPITVKLNLRSRRTKQEPAGEQGNY